MAGPVLDTLADTLLPDTLEFKSKTDKPKVTRESVWAEGVSSHLTNDLLLFWIIQRILFHDGLYNHYKTCLRKPYCSVCENQ